MKLIDIASIATLNLGRPTSIADAANLLSRFGEWKEGMQIDDIWEWGRQYVEYANPAHALLLAPLPEEFERTTRNTKGRTGSWSRGLDRVLIAQQW